MQRGPVDYLKNFVTRIFNFRDSEVERALLMQLCIFLIISTLLIVKPTVNGLFLAEFGIDLLPYAFLLVAVAAGFVSTVYSKLLFKYSLKDIFNATLISSVAFLIIFSLLLEFNIAVKFILFTFYVWVAIFALLTTSQFWIMANMLFDPREAKRIFSFIGAGAIAGGIFGGYLTSLITNSLGSELMPVIAAVFLTPTPFIVKYLWKVYITDQTTLTSQRSQSKYNSKKPIQIIKESRHLRLIATIVGVSVIVAKLVDYQFSGVASRLIPDPDELTAFFGFWLSTFNVISLILQLFVTRYIVGTYGVGTSLFFLPVTILVAVLVSFIFPELLFSVVLLKMSDGGLKQSVNKAAMELLVFPIAQELKNKTKTFIDVFVDSLSTGISGIVLLLFINGFDLSPRYVSLLIFMLVIYWVYIAYQVRNEYLNTLIIKLSSLSKSTKGKEIDLRKTSVFNGITKVLYNGTDQQKIFLLRKLTELYDLRLAPIYDKLLMSDNPDILIEVLHNMYPYKSEISLPRIKTLSRANLQSIKIKAIEYLIRHDNLNNYTLLNEYLKDNDERIWGATVVAIAKESRHNNKWAKRIGLKQLIQQSIKKSVVRNNHYGNQFTIITILKSIGYARMTEYYSFVNDYLEDKDLVIQKEAISAAGLTQSDWFFDSLMALLKIADTREASIHALIQYQEHFIPLFKEWAAIDEKANSNLQDIPTILKSIPLQSSISFLFELLDSDDNALRRESLRALNTLHNNQPQLWFDKTKIASKLNEISKKHFNLLTILYSQEYLAHSDDGAEAIMRDQLIKLLEQKLDFQLELIFRLLGLKYSSQKILPVYKSLKSDNKELRINAMEMLDNILDKDLKRILIPLVESSFMNSIRDEVFEKLKIDIPKEFQSYQELLRVGDIKLKVGVINLLKVKADKSYSIILEEAIPQNTSNPKIIEQLNEAIQTLNG